MLALALALGYILGMRNWLSISYLILSLFVLSCVSEREVTYEKGEAKGIRKYESDVKYVIDEQGNVRPNQDKRSRYDAKGSYAGAKTYSANDFGKAKYRSKRWNSNRGFDSKKFKNKGGNSYQQAPHFVQKQAAVQGEYSRFGKENYGTKGYQKGPNSVYATERVNRIVDVETSISNSGYSNPNVYSLQQMNEASVEDTNAMLGR